MNKIKPIKEVMLERKYNAPPETIWRALTDRDMLKEWWGPNNVTIPECEVDLTIPGKFYIVMEAGEGMGQYKGTKWPMLAQFTLIEPNYRLSYSALAWTEGKKDKTIVDQKTEMKLVEENGQTKLKVRAVIYKTGPEAKMAVQGMEAGFTQQLEKLNDFLNDIRKQSS